MEGGDSRFPPVAAMLMPAYTHTKAKADGPIRPGLRSNGNIVTQQVTGLLAGKIHGDPGAFVQVSGNPINGTAWFDGSDVRHVSPFKLLGEDAVFGITVNNTPTFQDAWKSVNSWSFPELRSGVTPLSVPQTPIDALAQRVVGACVLWTRIRQMTRSTFDMDSSGVVVMTLTGDFSEFTFPCRGFIMSGGGAIDFFGKFSGGIFSRSLCVYMFGFPVGSGVRCNGAFHAALPGVGLCTALAFYGPATIVDAL